VKKASIFRICIKNNIEKFDNTGPLKRHILIKYIKNELQINQFMLRSLKTTTKSSTILTIVSFNKNGKSK